MTKGRETTQAERIAVAKECIANGKNYGEVAIKYNVSYQQARSWTLKYIEGGESALEDRRGQRKQDQQPRTELEQAQIEIEQQQEQWQKCNLLFQIILPMGSDFSENMFDIFEKIAYTMCRQQQDCLPWR